MNNHRLLHNDIITNFFFVKLYQEFGLNYVSMTKSLCLLKTWFLFIRLHSRHHPLQECQLPHGRGTPSPVSPVAKEVARLWTIGQAV